VERSSRRRGQSLIVVGALLGALGGVALGLAVEDPQTSAVVAAPARVRGAAVAATPPTSQPAAAQPSSSGDRADGGEPTGRQRTQSVEHPGTARTKGGRDGKGSRKGKNK
jgi:hypothetical protein